jgi:hypothetical protein
MMEYAAMSNQRTICLWSGPRNVSTALMYSFRQRSDTRVVDEPLYGHFLRVSGAEHPAALEVMKHMDCDGDRVMRRLLIAENEERPVQFIKQMAHHLVEIDERFLRVTTNVLLVRDPGEMLPSLVNQIPRPTIRDTGLKRQWELFEDLLLHGEHHPPVLDARELLLDPPGVLRKLCAILGLAFEPAMLSWPPGPKPEDGVWAPHWYHNVHLSSGFSEYRSKDQPLPSRLEALREECNHYYQRLFAHSLKATT